MCSFSEIFNKMKMSDYIRSNLFCLKIWFVMQKPSLWCCLVWVIGSCHPYVLLIVCSWSLCRTSPPSEKSLDVSWKLKCFRENVANNILLFLDTLMLWSFFYSHSVHFLQNLHFNIKSILNFKSLLLQYYQYPSLL